MENSVSHFSRAVWRFREYWWAVRNINCSESDLIWKYSTLEFFDDIKWKPYAVIMLVSLVMWFLFSDETRPTAICPNDQITDAQVEGNTMATVSFTATCRDNIDENITPNCTAFSDITLFSVGETTVTCSCTDHSDHTSQCSFNVTVKGKY